jgi:heptosyltransferase-1
LIALVRRAGVVVAGDTGPLHLAAAQERPVVAIFGPTDPARNGPFGTRARVFRDAGSVTSHKRLEEPEAGMLRISVDDVVAAALELLG